MTVSGGRAGLRVLVVDDDADTATSTGEVLTLYGFDVRTATGGPAAIEAVGRDLPDVVLLDLSMPGTDGFEVARTVRAACAAVFARPPAFVAITGHGA